MSLRWIFMAALTALAACSAPAVPDFTWYRLPRAEPLEPAAMPLFRDPVVVGAFGADGLYGDQPLIYALDPSAQQLRQYHYQLWTDPPARMLQRRLIAQLREAHASAEVTDELSASEPAIRIGGVILRFDRVPAAVGGFNVVVALKLRADRRDGAPLVDDYYHAEVPVGGANLKAAVDAYGVALDTIFAQFYRALRKAGADAHAG
jgi:cholesterol transport system auxiliary component